MNQLVYTKEQKNGTFEAQFQVSMKPPFDGRYFHGEMSQADVIQHSPHMLMFDSLVGRTYRA